MLNLIKIGAVAWPLQLSKHTETQHCDYTALFLSNKPFVEFRLLVSLNINEKYKQIQSETKK